MTTSRSSLILCRVELDLHIVIVNTVRASSIGAIKRYMSSYAGKVLPLVSSAKGSSAKAIKNT
jgi:tRNA C32,U32 (ribose-2'-O)-methylase TrmJ